MRRCWVTENGGFAARKAGFSRFRCGFAACLDGLGDLGGEKNQTNESGMGRVEISLRLVGDVEGYNPPAVIVCAGGGYCFRADHEADPVARRMAANGIKSFVLDYGVAPARFPQASSPATSRPSSPRCRQAPRGRRP